MRMMKIKNLIMLILLCCFMSPSALGAIKQEKKFDSSLTPDLIYRVAFGRADDVGILLKQNADPNARNDARIPVLIIAVVRKDDESPNIVKYLLANGANVNILGPQNNTPVLEAVKAGRPDVLQLLIDGGAVLAGVYDVNGQDLLTLAQNRGDYQIISTLNAGIAAEKDRFNAMKSPESFVKMVQRYAYLSCANEYLNYYLSIEADKVDPVKFDKIISSNNDEIDAQGRRIKYIFKMGDKELGGIKLKARQAIINDLKSLGSSHNQEFNGVGTDEDLNKRCTAVAARWDLQSLDKDQYNVNTGE